MENTSTTGFVQKYRYLLVAILLAFSTLVLIQVNYNKNHMSAYSVDEYYTITTIHPNYSSENIIYRALNGPRLFTYIFYPGALVGMISHMGGNIYLESWEYPGHKYFVKNYQRSTSKLAENMADPNFRYLHYYLKLQGVILAFLTFLPLIFYLFKRKYFIAMFMISTLVGINLLLLEERSVFYIEPLLLAMFNILTWYYLFTFELKKLNNFIIILGGFLMALTISLKFSSLIFLLLIAVSITVKKGSVIKKIQRSLLLAVSTLIFFSLINWDVFAGKEVFGAMVHDYFSNFYQYSTGNNALLYENYKLHNLQRILKEYQSSLGGLLYVFPFIVYFGFRGLPRNEKLKWAGLLIVVVISLWLIISQKVYMDRNALPFLTLLIMLTGVFLDSIFKGLKAKGQIDDSKRKWGLGISFALVLLLPIFLHSNDYFKKVFPNSANNVLNELSQLPLKEDFRLVKIGNNLKVDKTGIDSVLVLKNFPQVNARNLPSALLGFQDSLNINDVVVVRNTGNNNQLTNYLLPKLYNSNFQYGELFVFYNDESKLPEVLKGSNDNFKSLLATPTNFREDIVLNGINAVNNRGKIRIYIELTPKNSFKIDLVGCRFYIHAYPNEIDLDKLSSDRQVHGFENWGFTITNDNMFRYGKNYYVFKDIEMNFDEVAKLGIGIFKGCPESEDIFLNDIKF